MRSDGDIEKLLRDHEKRITQLESLCGKKKETSTKKNDDSQMKLTDHILAARDGMFFSKPKTAEEIHRKLQGTYHCDLNRVAVALLRLAGRRKLRRTTKAVNGKEYQAYVW